jgi:hypothetical protein
MNMDEKPITDMYLAAALLAYGFTMNRVDKSNKKRQQFYFLEDAKEVYTLNGIMPLRHVEPIIEDVETWFYGKKLMFPPHYPDSIKSIKSAIHS